MLNTPRPQDFDQRLRPTVSGHSLAVVCVLLYINPAATGLAASPPSTTSVTLNWAASTSTNVTGYKLYYGAASGSYTQVVSAGLVTQATIAGLTSGTTYFFAAAACDDAGVESFYSNEAACAVPAPRPAVSLPELSLLRTETNTVLQWPTNYPGYTLQWSSSPAGAWTDLTSSPAISGSCFTCKNTTSAARRFYRLKE